MKSRPRCPHCASELTERGAHFPFCSERCKSLDLGAWASGRYSIPAENVSTTAEDFAADTGAERPTGATKKKG